MSSEFLNNFELGPVESIAVLDDAAGLKERVKYDSYGRALHHE